MKSLKTYSSLGLFIFLLSGCNTLDNAMHRLGALNVKTVMPEQKPPAINDTLEMQQVEKCPETLIVQDLSIYNGFINIQTPIYEELASKAIITNVESSCFYKENKINIDLDISFEIMQFIKQSDYTSYNFPFFVSVISSSGDILSKEIFNVDFSYDSSQNYKIQYYNANKFIHLMNPEISKDYKILIGFQLSKEQLIYNRLESFR